MHAIMGQMQKASLLRVTAPQRFAVRLHDTGSILCVEWSCDDKATLAALSKVSAMSPLDVEVTLDKYFPNKAYFSGDVKVDLSAIKFPEGVTRYKRVKV